MAIVITKTFQNVATFQVFLFVSVSNMFLKKTFSKSEMDIYQILRLIYCKQLENWWTDEVDGDVLVLTCIETQIIHYFCQKDGEEFSEKKSAARFINNAFI